MRTAEEIIAKIGEFTPAVFQKKYRTKGVINIDEAIAMINEAREEAIEECAKAARIKLHYLEKSDVYLPTNTIDEESILNLIKELK